MNKLLLFVLFAGIALCDPIPVNMAGKFGLDNFMQSNVQFGLAGSNGSGSIEFDGDLPLGTLPPDQGFSASSLHNIPLQDSPVTVDGMMSPFWIFSLDSTGAGFVELLDSSGNLITREDFALAAPIQYSSYEESGSRLGPGGGLNDDWEVSGTFSTLLPAGSDQTDVPESGSAVLAGAGLLWLLAIQGRKRFCKSSAPANHP